MKKISVCFWILAALLSDLMCVVIAWNYCNMLWGIKYEGYSAPASTTFLLAIPFAFGIVICIVLAFFFKKNRLYRIRRVIYQGGQTHENIRIVFNDDR